MSKLYVEKGGEGGGGGGGGGGSLVPRPRQTTSYIGTVPMHIIVPLFLLAAYGLTGLSRGGQQVSKCKEVFGKAVKLLVDLASLQVCT